MTSPPDDTILQVFVMSCREQLDQVESIILDLEGAITKDSPQDRINRLFRVAHAIKGDAASIGLTDISDLAHGIENVLSMIREGRLEIKSRTINVLLAGFDRLRSYLEFPDDSNNTEKDFLDFLNRFTENPEAESPGFQLFDGGAERADSPADSSISEGVEQSIDGRIRSVHVQADRLDVLVGYVGELTLAQSELMQTVRFDENERTRFLVEEIGRFSAFLRTEILGMRMLPLSVIFSKFRRIVRDLCRENQKQVELVVRGAETEVDKTVLEELNAPLIHLLRNAVDHGLESPEERRRSGKPETGRITVRAQHVGNEVFITLQDDGRGIDAGSLIARAGESGMIAEGDDPSKIDLLELISRPGMTTARDISRTSGRGVGMEAVKKGAEAMRGTLSLFTEAGRGSMFRLQIPLTSAIVQCLRARVGNGVFLIHLDYVEECIDYDRDTKKRLRTINAVTLRGALLPVVHLRAFFGAESPRPPKETVVVVVVRNQRFGLVVDRVEGIGHVVIHKPTKLYRDVAGIGGAAVTETGDIALVLDLPKLVPGG